MPDLKSELAKLKNLKFDDDDSETTPATPTSATAEQSPNMTRKVFEYVKLHPMVAASEVADALGHDRSRVATLAVQLTQRKLLTRKKVGTEPYQYTAAVDVFPDTDEARLAGLTRAHAAKKLLNAQRKRAEAARAAKAAKAKKALPTVNVEVEPPQTPKAGFNAAMLVGGLTPFQARQVYDELKKLFA